MALTEKLTAIADAIREKTGEVAALSLEAMVEAIEGIKTEPEIKMATVTITGLKTSTLSSLSSSYAHMRYSNSDKTGFISKTISISSSGTQNTIEVPVGGVIMIQLSGTASTSDFYLTLSPTSGVSVSSAISTTWNPTSSKYSKNNTWVILVKEENASFTAKVY